jgi:hypothetical protein
MEAAGDLGPGPAQVPVPFGPHLQHGRLVLCGDFSPGGRAERGDRDRPAARWQETAKSAVGPVRPR